MSTAEREINLYMEYARHMLEVAAHNIADGFFGSQSTAPITPYFTRPTPCWLLGGWHAASIRRWLPPSESIL
jgi:hypothetical protein